MVMLHALVPWQFAVELSPAFRLHVLPPPHVEVQFEPHVPLHSDLPSHVVVQPVPQSVLHVFLELQSYVALLGGAEVPPSVALASPPSAPTVPLLPPDVPMLHVPPD